MSLARRSGRSPMISMDAAVARSGRSPTSDFISHQFITRNRLPSTSLSTKTSLRLVDGPSHSITRRASALALRFPGFMGTVTPLIVPLRGYDLILGMPGWSSITLTLIGERGRSHSPARPAVSLPRPRIHGRTPRGSNQTQGIRLVTPLNSTSLPRLPNYGDGDNKRTV